MTVIERWTTIPVTQDMAKRLRKLGRKGDRYEDILNRLLGSVDWKGVDHYDHASG